MQRESLSLLNNSIGLVKATVDNELDYIWLLKLYPLRVVITERLTKIKKEKDYDMEWMNDEWMMNEWWMNDERKINSLV